MKRLLLICATILFSSVFSPEVSACRCAEYDTPVCALFGRADAVFVGRIAEKKPAKDPNGDSYLELHFIVDEAFKGISGVQVVVGTPTGTSCDMTFTKGKRYLIYASRGSTNLLDTGTCSGSGLVEHGDKDLDYLRRVTQQGVTESVSGRVQKGGYLDLEGLRVTAEGGEKAVETTTGAKGKFSLSLPGPGTYKVRVFAPFAAAAMSYREGGLKEKATDTLTTIEYEVKLKKNQCDYSELNLIEINLHATAEIAGHVLNEFGQPLQGRGRVYLFDAVDSRDSGVSTRLEADGSFKYRDLPPGEYYLVVNPRDQAPDEDDAPYPRTYYPGVANSSDATRIVVTEGAKLENLTLRLGKPMPERVVTGTVAWHDRRLLKKTHLSLYSGDRYLGQIAVDEKGNFSFKIYGDFPYSVRAQADVHPFGESERVELVDEKLTGIKLTLREIK